MSDRMRAALEYLADPESWAGDPLTHDAVLYGHDTPYELARAALGRGGTMSGTDATLGTT